MSRFTDDEIVSMTQQYSQDQDGNFISHVAYEEINNQVNSGRQWSKCPNCGNPYPLDKEDTSSTYCSSKCAKEYLEYINTERL